MTDHLIRSHISALLVCNGPVELFWKNYTDRLVLDQAKTLSKYWAVLLWQFLLHEDYVVGIQFKVNLICGQVNSPLVLNDSERRIVIQNDSWVLLTCGMWKSLLLFALLFIWFGLILIWITFSHRSWKVLLMLPSLSATFYVRLYLLDCCLYTAFFQLAALLHFLVLVFNQGDQTFFT